MNRWDERYGDADYFYGEEPNQHVARALADLPPGRGLFPAEGEGRNAVHAARLGHDVVALDTSAEGRKKALALAAARQVTIDYRLEDVTAADWPPASFDFAVLCFVHLPPAELENFHHRVALALRAGGRLVLQSFAKEQFGRTSGGPPDREWLHDLTGLQEQFPGVVWDLARQREVTLRESVGHAGQAAVIELIGTKREPSAPVD